MTQPIGFGLAALKTEGTPAPYSEGEWVSSAPPPTWEELLVKKIVATEGDGTIIQKIVGRINVTSDQYEAKPDIAWTAWTVDRVYFPAGYDGSVWVASVPRNPCDERTPIVGGGVK